jgi:hypothetical protein
VFVLSGRLLSLQELSTTIARLRQQNASARLEYGSALQKRKAEERLERQIERVRSEFSTTVRAAERLRCTNTLMSVSQETEGARQKKQIDSLRKEKLHLHSVRSKIVSSYDNMHGCP